MNEYDFTLSEIKTLEELLRETPEDCIFERMSLESRLARVREILNEMPAPNEIPSPKENPKVRLTFRGDPVRGSRGIFADFGAKATSAFSELYATVAAGLYQNVQNKGRIPDLNKNRLLITGVATGSFGFEFELPAEEADLFPETGPTVLSLELIHDLFRTAAQGDDDAIAELLNEIPVRCVKKAYEFLEILDKQGAFCAIEFGDKTFRYKDSAQVRESAQRLMNDNIHEYNRSLEGRFVGILPNTRTFEFQSKDTFIKGTISREISEPEILNHKWLYKDVMVDFGALQVGKGQIKYKLRSLEHIKSLL